MRDGLQGDGHHSTLGAATLSVAAGPKSEQLKGACARPRSAAKCLRYLEPITALRAQPLHAALFFAHLKILKAKAALAEISFPACPYPAEFPGALARAGYLAVWAERPVSRSLGSFATANSLYW